jgi:hypothetical protein
LGLLIFAAPENIFLNAFQQSPCQAFNALIYSGYFISPRRYGFCNAPPQGGSARFGAADGACRASRAPQGNAMGL